MRQTTLTFSKKGISIEDSKKEVRPKKRPLEECPKEINETKHVPKRSKSDPLDRKPDLLSESGTEPIPEGNVPQVSLTTPPTAEPKQKPRAPKPLPTHKIVDRLFHPINDAPFYEDENVPFSFIAQSLQEIEKCKGENSKDAIKEVISNVLRSVSLLHPQELASAFYFYVVKLAPEYKHKETGIGQEILVKAIARVVGRSEREVREDKVALGDLGLVLAESKGSIRTMDSFFIKKKAKQITVTLCDVMTTFNKIAETHGSNSQAEKLNLLAKLLFDAEKEEGKYIVRWLEGNLKVGAGEQTIISALARAACLTPFNQSFTSAKVNMRDHCSKATLDAQIEKAEANIKRAISEYPNYEALMEALTKVGTDTEKLKELCYIRPGTPVKPMLAKPTKGVQVILKRFENVEFTCEYKYDGFRGQIHFIRGENGVDVHVFSRNLEDMTETYPDVVDFMKESVGKHVNNFIMDSELVAYDRKTDRILPFQELTTRARKKVQKKAIEVEVCIFAFDLLYFNDVSLLQTAFGDRRELLHKNFEETKQQFSFAKYMDAKTPEEMQAFLDESIRSSCEGLMVKTLKENSSYEPSKRSFKWLKLKKDYLDNGIGDSLDLVVVGADYGKGKRTGVYGSFLLAVYDPDTGTFQTTSKLGTGLSDEELQKAFDELQPHLTERIPSNVRHKDNDPDVWFEPKIVWEMKAADLTLSPVYYAALGSIEDEKGIGLRFPRFLRWRNDKRPKEASTSNQLIEMYKSQAVVNVEFKDEEY